MAGIQVPDGKSFAWMARQLVYGVQQLDQTSDRPDDVGMKAVFVLMDSLNRHYLSAYGDDRVRTPNIDRFRDMSIRFTNHWLGSAPCMPARRDLLTGRLHFLERDWGGLEPFDVPFTRILRSRGIFTHMETDHFHYFHPGGEGYTTSFDSWSFHRGQEMDTAVSRIVRPTEPQHLGQWSAQYALNQTEMRREEDYPTPKTFAGAISWLRANRGADDYFLWVEAFDPHEPFDAPTHYLDLYNDSWSGPRYDWSGYEKVDEDSDETAHLRNQYAATLSMTDAWFGKLLDEIDSQGGLDDTLIILTTDHGHLLGEHGATGKNRWHAWTEISHLPLFVHLPGGVHAGEDRHQLTQNVDLFPTLLDYFGCDWSHEIHGESWLRVLHDNAPVGREAAIFGWHGRTVNVCDGTRIYMRSPRSSENRPLYTYGLNPATYSLHDLPPKEYFAEAKIGRFLPYTDYPVVRTRSLPWISPESIADIATTQLFDLESDPRQERNLAGSDLEASYVEVLIREMKRAGSPVEQFERLGLDDHRG